MEELRAKQELDTPVGRRCSKWTAQDMNASPQVKMDGAYSAGSMAMKLYGPIITSLGFTVPLLRQIYRGIVSEEGRQEGVTKEIKRLKEDLSGLPCTVDEIECWIMAQDLSHDTEHLDELRKLLDKQFKEVCRDFLRVSQNSEASLFLSSKLSIIEGPCAKCVSDVHDIIGSIIQHLQGKRRVGRREISEDEFLSMVERGPVQIGYSPNRECLELNVIPYLGKRRPDRSVVGCSFFTRVKWHTSVRHDLVQLLLFVDWSVVEGPGDCLETLQPHEVKDAVCFVSRTIGGTGGIPSYVERIRPVGTFKKRLRVVTTGTSDTPYYITRSGRLIASKRSVSLWTGTRSFRLLAATRRRPRAPPLWIYDTGSSISVTGNLRLLRGVHDADNMHSRGVSGVELVSNKCGRIRSGRVKLSGVRYFPGAKVNLISGGILGSLGCEIIMNAKGCKIMKDGQVIGGGRMLANRTYSVDFLDDKLLGGGICHDCPH